MECVSIENILSGEKKLKAPFFYTTQIKRKKIISALNVAHIRRGLYVSSTYKTHKKSLKLQFTQTHRSRGTFNRRI